MDPEKESEYFSLWVSEWYGYFIYIFIFTFMFACILVFPVVIYILVVLDKFLPVKHLYLMDQLLQHLHRRRWMMRLPASFCQILQVIVMHESEKPCSHKSDASSASC